MGMEEAVPSKLERRLGRLHAKLRLGIETDHEAQIFGQGINFFHIENWYSVHSVIRTMLKLMGLYWRGRRNAVQIQVRHNHIEMNALPSRFNGFTLLHICSTNARRFYAGIKRSIWPVSTTRTIIESTISKRLRPKFPTTDSQSFCHTRQKSTAKLHMLDSICF